MGIFAGNTSVGKACVAAVGPARSFGTTSPTRVMYWRASIMRFAIVDERRW